MNKQEKVFDFAEYLFDFIKEKSSINKCKYCNKDLTGMYDCCEKLRNEILEEIENDFLDQWNDNRPTITEV